MRLKELEKNQAGFTIFELLVSIFIIALISGTFLTNYRSGGKRSELLSLAQKLASDIRIAQSYSLGAKETAAGTMPAGGWGVFFNKTTPQTYTLFADTSGNFQRESTEDYTIVNIPPNVEINSITLNGVSVNSVDVAFCPPDPKVYINGLLNQSAQIIIKEKDTNATKTININSLGLIEVN